MSRTMSNLLSRNVDEPRSENELRLASIKEEIASVEVTLHKIKGNMQFGWSTEDHDGLMKSVGHSKFKTKIMSL